MVSPKLGYKYVQQNNFGECYRGMNFTEITRPGKGDRYTVRNFLEDFAVLFVTDDAIAQLYVTYSLVKWRETVENLVTYS